MNFMFTTESGEEVEVSGQYHGASRGYRNSLGVPEEPDESAYFEVFSISNMVGYEIEVSENDFEKIQERADELVRERDYCNED